MTLFTRLPISVAASLPILSESDIAYFSGLEEGAYEHWIFDKGGVGGLTGRVKGKVLTVQSAVPTYAANYLSMQNDVGKGLLTDLLEPADATLTYCAVVREPIAGAGGIKVPFGTLNTTAGGSGGMPFISGAGAARKLYTTYLGFTPSTDTAQAAPDSQFLFIAAALDFKSATRTRRTLVGGAAGHLSSSSASYAASSRTVALGNGYYVTGAAAPFDFAEFVCFDRTLSAADLVAVYARSKTRMAARGITVV